MDKTVRELVWQRSKGRCEACGLPLDEETWDFSHRKAKSNFSKRGETPDFVENGMAIHHFPCHMVSVENHPVLARQKGWRVPSYRDPRTEPIALYGAIWVHLNANGTYSEVKDPELLLYYTSLQKEGK